MPILIYGLNHRTAELDLRGQLAFGADELADATRQLCDHSEQISEAAILSTCNRTELHVNSTNPSDQDIATWLCESRQVSEQELRPVAYSYRGNAAIAHVMRVAAGLDSQIVGEPQIQGQFKSAYRTAHDVGTLGSELRLLEEFTLQTAKKIRTETSINKEPVSVAYATLTMAKQIFAEFSQSSTLLIGAGGNIRQIAQYFKEEGAQRFTIANRTLANAESLTREFNGEAITLDRIPEYLHQFDLVVSSTSSSEPVVTESMLRAAARKRRHKPMFIADLAVPRDIEASADTIPDIYLHTIDDLSKIISENVAQRHQVVHEAEQYISEGVQCFEKKHRVQLSASMLKQYRTQIESTRDEALEKALKRLEAGDEPANVLSKFAHELSNQLAHKPTLSIRQASIHDDSDLLHFLKQIYKLDD